MKSKDEWGPADHLANSFMVMAGHLATALVFIWIGIVFCLVLGSILFGGHLFFGH